MDYITCIVHYILVACFVYYFGCTEFFVAAWAFLWSWLVGVLSSRGVQASHCRASLVVEHGLWCVFASAVVPYGLCGCNSWSLEHRLNSWGAWAWLFRGMWDHSRPGIEPMSPALVGGFFTTEPPGKPLFLDFLMDSFEKCCITDLLGDTESGIL